MRRIPQIALKVRPQQSPSYPVYVEDNLDAWSSGYLPELANHGRHFLLSQSNIKEHVVRPVLSCLQRYFPDGLEDRRLIWLKDGEQYKHFKYLQPIYKQLIENGVDRNSCLIALGGGVVGDLSGFVAATLLRGISLIHLPSTLLAIIDSSIGGKVGVNTDQGKNMIGAFYHPRLVYCNTTFLKTLPQKEHLCGLVEMFKHSLIEKSGQVFRHLLKNRAALFEPLSPQFHRAIVNSIKVKAAIVASDEKEANRRAFLNLGHTTAHALEVLGKYRLFSHGEAVAQGLVSALFLSRNLLNLSNLYMEEVLEFMQSLGLPMASANFKAPEIFTQMRYDKKSVDGKPKFVLIKAPGQLVRDVPVSLSDFQRVWREQTERYPQVGIQR